MNKKVRWGIIGATSLLVLGIGLFTINETNYSKKVEVIISEQSTNDQMVQELKKELQVFYVDDAKIFLSEKISQEKIDALTKKLNKYSQESQSFQKKIKNLRKTDRKKYQFNVNNLSILQDEVKIIQQKFNAQKAVNGLFQSPYLKEATENKEAVIIDDLTAEKLNEVKEAFVQEVNEKDESKKFEVIINSGVEVAQKQVEQINKTKKMINELYKDNKVTEKVTRENYESTKKEVEQIKNQKAKESFTDILKTIEAKVQEDEAYKQKLEADKEAEEAKRQAEEAEKQALKQAEEARNAVEEIPVVETTTTESIVETPTDQQTTTPTVPSTNTTGSNNSTNNVSGGSSSSNNTGGASTGSNSGGSSSNGNTGGSSGGNTNPTPPAPEKPYAVNPYTGSGAQYLSWDRAINDAQIKMADPNSGIKGYRIITEYWSDGTEKYYLEFY